MIAGCIGMGIADCAAEAELLDVSQGYCLALPDGVLIRLGLRRQCRALLYITRELPAKPKSFFAAIEPISALSGLHAC